MPLKYPFKSLSIRMTFQ